METGFLWVVPFVLLLLCIALVPLGAPHFWEKNRNKALLSSALALPVALYLILHYPDSLVHTLREYGSFITILLALFVITGGIRLTGDLRATPLVNSCFLAIGAVLANFIGTTGASMLLIRSLLQTNQERKHTRHLPVFFIFIVSNMGGLLTPMGDPPLFLGYLRGVSFFWTLKLWPMWLLANGMILAVFFILDRRAYAKESAAALKRDETRITPLRIEGSVNFLFLAGVLISVFFPTPIRELAMLILALLSFLVTHPRIREKNRFTSGPIIEVAILFLGIFITMVPALELLKIHGPEFGVTRPYEFFWLTGLLSSFLDNAPTYLTFFSMAQGLNLPGSLPVGVTEAILKAISCGAVFMGANTYIGNGPNFMVKAIADEAGYRMPSFFGYMRYSLVFLMPVFLVITFIFFR